MNYLKIVLAVLLVAFGLGRATAHSGHFDVLAYHDVRDDVVDDLDPDQYAVGTDRLVQQFAWLREHGYRPVSVDDVIAARKGVKPLPPKAVLLSFDDGFASVYRRVYPLLKLYGYPAVVAVVASWMERREGERIPYGRINMPRDKFLRWWQIREMQDSGLIEIASHSYDLHRGVISNPQGNEQASAVMRRYDPVLGAYESESAYRKRIHDDLRLSADIIERGAGRRPRVMVWPYGKLNDVTEAAAAAAGMPYTMTLLSGVNAPADLARMKRILIEANPRLGDFVVPLMRPQRPEPLRVVHVDLDYVYDPDPAIQEKNLGVLLDRVKASGVNTVFLQAFADADGDGDAEAVYFPNRHMPMRADLFARVSWQLKTRAGVRVYAWMPVLAFQLPATAAPPPIVLARRNGITAAQPDGYHRLSPFDQRSRDLIKAIYADLGRQVDIDGVLFHDDATLNDFEDASVAALAAYTAEPGLRADIDAMRNDPRAFARWTRFKTRSLLDFTNELAAILKAKRPGLKTARNLYANVALNPESEAWFAQSLDGFLNTYDYTAVMAMPFMENAPDPKAWLNRLITRIASRPHGLAKTVFELQARDWRHQTAVPDATLKAQMQLLQSRGAMSFGYYPDDFHHDQPALKLLRSTLSVRTYPFKD